LINHVLRQGTPMEKLTTEKRLTFKEEMRQARNAEEALLVALNACALITKELSNVSFPKDYSIGDWLRKLHSFITRQNLRYLNLVTARLDEANLAEANLAEANLLEANLAEANLAEANLKGAFFERANLFRANLIGANLEQAYLYGTYLERTNLYGAYLVEANLTGANLIGAYLVEANLTGANLVEASLDEANLIGANLEQAIWQNGVRIIKKLSEDEWLLEDGSRLIIGDRTFELIEKESETTDE
jgi:uncharacterized protein YjbI with pentapeptide repeats